MSEDRLTRMFEKQLDFQRRMGVDPVHMVGDVRTAWLAHMIHAAADELHEALNEVGWKQWATSRHINEEACFGELRDCWQFLTNALFTVYQVSPTQMAELFEAALDWKLEKNHARADSGYTGTEKCPGCRRALDEVKLYHAGDDASGKLVYCQCGAFVDAKIAAPYLID